jgi:hypothetical protein
MVQISFLSLLSPSENERTLGALSSVTLPRTDGRTDSRDMKIQISKIVDHDGAHSADHCATGNYNISSCLHSHLVTTAT